MTAHEEEEVTSSPLSSPASSIFALDDFDAPPLKRAPGPALTDNLPPFNPKAQQTPTAEPVSKSRSSSGGSLPNVLRDKTMPGSNPDDGEIADTIVAHVHGVGCEHDHGDEACTADHPEHPSTADNSPDTAAADNRQATPPAEKGPATPESPDPIAADTSTNGRKRKAPESSSKTKKKVVLKKARKNDATKWQAPAVFTDAKSPLVTAPLRVSLPVYRQNPFPALYVNSKPPQAILLHPQAWDVLSPTDQAELSAMLSHDRPASVSTSPSPPGSGPRARGSPEQPSRPNLDYLRSDDSFRFDCARYTENIEQGCHDPGWLAESWTAHERRKRGDFREYLAQKLVRDWDVEVPAKEESEEGGERKEERASDEDATTGGGGGNEKDGAALGGSPVTSSVGETRLTDMKLEAAASNAKQPATEAEEGAEKAGKAGEDVVG